MTIEELRHSLEHSKFIIMPMDIYEKIIPLPEPLFKKWAKEIKKLREL